LYIGYKIMSEFVIKYFDELPSTNDYLKEQDFPDKTVIVARSQTKGKGRLGRSWDNVPGEAIAMSAILKPDISIENAPFITLITAIALSHVLEEETGLKHKIKWPNDVIIAKKKVAGILTEMKVSDNALVYIISGIGINVNTKSFSEELRNKATSLYIESGKEFDIEHIIERFWSKFAKYYDSFVKNDGFDSFVEEYNSLLVNINQEVDIISNDKTTRGVALGINRSGELIVLLKDGTKTTVRSGEVSVRGIYGYV